MIKNGPDIPPEPQNEFQAILSGLPLDHGWRRRSKRIGSLGIFVRICMTFLKSHAGSIMESKCNHISILMGSQTDLNKITLS